MSDTGDHRADAQRALMDRARAQAAGDRQKQPRPVVPRIVAGVLAVTVVFVVMMGFDAFLTMVQKVLEIQVTEPPPDPAAPIPAYVVPEP